MQSPDLFPTMLSWSGKAFRQIILMRELTTSHPVTLCWHWYDIDTAWRCNLNKQVSWEFLGTWEAAWSFLLYASFCYRFLSTWATEKKQKPWLVEADEVYFGEQPYSCIVECFEMHQEWSFLTNLVCKWGRYSDCYVTSPADHLSFSDANFELWKASFAARQKRQHRLTTRTVVHLETFLWGCGHCPFK